MTDVKHLTLPVGGLSADERAEMKGLMTSYYLGADPRQFEADLDEKEQVILLRDGTATGRIVGFSTLMLLDLEVVGKPVKAVFSGDTIVDRASRGTLGLGLEITRYFLQTLREHPDTELFYILIAKGWQTARIPELLFRSYSPSPAHPVPAEHKQVIDAFGATKYPNNYQSESGLITFSGEAQRVIPDSAEGTIPSRPNAQVDFFVQKNPDYLQGNELVYVAPIAEWNFTRVFKKLLTTGNELHLVG